MSVLLVRVDDRLIHGQVVIGWGRAVNCERIVLIDDGIAHNNWEQELYRMGVPENMTVEFASVSEAASAYPAWTANGQRTIVLLTDVDTLVRFCSVAPVTKVNLGGIHGGEDRTERLSYVFLSQWELEQLRDLSARGIEITAQDVPTARAIALQDLAR
ncbi:MAG: PTS sugar transporter subunit IIB [Gemmatimonadales bacterium]